MLMQPLLRRCWTMKCLLTQSLHFPLPKFPISAANICDSNQILKLPSFSSDFLGSNYRINLREYCSKSVTGLKSTAKARVVQDPESISYLNQRDATEIDEILMGPLGFSVDQLMVYKLTECNRALAICGLGNNGGDGLVAARCLHHFGYKGVIRYPKCTAKALYNGLVTQLESLSIPFLSVEDLPVDLSTSYDVVVDAIFGFLFHGSPRPPFDGLIQRLIDLGNLNQKQPKLPAIVSVDIPYGWHVEEARKVILMVKESNEICWLLQAIGGWLSLWAKHWMHGVSQIRIYLVIYMGILVQEGLFSGSKSFRRGSECV